MRQNEGKYSPAKYLLKKNNVQRHAHSLINQEYIQKNWMRIFFELNHTQKDQQRNWSKNNGIQLDHIMTGNCWLQFIFGLLEMVITYNHRFRFTVYITFSELNFMCIACCFVIWNKWELIVLVILNLKKNLVSYQLR